jgi:hypothetical protein
MSAPKVDVLADGLRRLCGHDSRSVDGCVTCEAADSLEDGERRNAAVAELIEAAECMLCAAYRGPDQDALRTALANIGPQS